MAAPGMAGWVLKSVSNRFFTYDDTGVFKVCHQNNDKCLGADFRGFNRLLINVGDLCFLVLQQVHNERRYKM